jgi:hypothetical protein
MMVGIMSPNEPPPLPRFLTIQNVGLELATSKSQIYALLRSGELTGIQIGGPQPVADRKSQNSRSTSPAPTGARRRHWPIYPPI